MLLVNEAEVTKVKERSGEGRAREGKKREREREGEREKEEEKMRREEVEKLKKITHTHTRHATHVVHTYLIDLSIVIRRQRTITDQFPSELQFLYELAP